MMMLWNLFDGVLALLVMVLGWLVVSSQDMKRAVVLFIAFGLLMSLIWARLAAPDLALAEAAIGAGLTGALLLSALRQQPGDNESPVISLMDSYGSLLLTAGLGGMMAWAMYIEPGIVQGHAAQNPIYQNLEQSGVSNPVTAVLLNFRVYDTLLEIAVLFCVAVGVLAFGRERQQMKPAGAMLLVLIRVLVPLLVVMSSYLLWVGAHAPGGAFQAGAVLAAAGILLHLGGKPALGIPGPSNLRGLLIAGLACFLLVGLATMLNGSSFLTYPQAWTGTLILLIETGAVLSIAATLVLAYRGGDVAPVSSVAGDTHKEGR